MPCGGSVAENGYEDVVERRTPGAAGAEAAIDAILKLSVEELRPRIRLVMVAGELDVLSAPRLRQSVNRELADGPRGLILNLDGLTFLSVAGIRILLQAAEAARHESVRLRLVCNVRAVLRPLELCGVLDQFNISDTLHDALGRYQWSADVTTREARPA